MIDREDWAEAFLDELGAPTTKRNLRAMVAWASAEGTDAKYNPLATTREWKGATDFNSTGVKNYASLDDGIKATVATILEDDHGYEPIVWGLNHSARPRRTLAAVEASHWGTGGLALLVLRSMREFDSYITYARKPIGQ